MGQTEGCSDSKHLAKLLLFSLYHQLLFGWCVMAYVVLQVQPGDAAAVSMALSGSGSCPDPVEGGCSAEQGDHGKAL